MANGVITNPNKASTFTPTAINGDVTWTTSAGQLRLTGTISGTTTAVITLGKTSY